MSNIAQDLLVPLILYRNCKAKFTNKFAADLDTENLVLMNNFWPFPPPDTDNVQKVKTPG